MYSVLIIDDEPWALRGLQNSCDWQSCAISDVTGVQNSHDAIEHIRKNSPDIVISDIRMPGLTGIDILKYVRNNNINSAFIFVSGFSEFEYAHEALNNGALAYLLKPIDPEKLEEAVKAACLYLDEISYGKKMKKSQKEDVFIPSGYINKSFLELFDYVNSNFTSNLSLSMLSGIYHLNQTYISDLFKKVTGKSFSKYLTELRIRFACELLRSTHMSINEISNRAGYSDYGNFIRAFKLICKTTPLKYREGDNG